MTQEIEWRTSATEVRPALPHKGLDDVGHGPEVVWEAQDPETHEWHTVDGGSFIPADRNAAIVVRAKIEIESKLLEAASTEFPEYGFCLGLIAASSSSRWRASQWSDGLQNCSLELTICPDEWRGTVDLRVVSVVAQSPEAAELPLPPRDAIIWTCRNPLAVQLDNTSPSSSAGFDVQWVDNLPEHQLFRLVKSPSGTGIQPRLELNASHPDVSWAWGAPGTTGPRATMRNILTSFVATDVLVDLAVLAAEIDTDSASEEDIEFKQQIEATLIRKFKVQETLLFGVDKDIERRDDLRGAIQNSPRIRLAAHASSAVQCIRS